jgi:hypothetical protein
MKCYSWQENKLYDYQQEYEEMWGKVWFPENKTQWLEKRMKETENKVTQLEAAGLPQRK